MCMASTRAHAGWFTRCCVELPSTNPTNTVQKQYKNRPTTVQQPYTNRTQTVQKPVQQSSIACTKKAAAPAAAPAGYARIRLTRSQNEKYPLDPKGGAGATPRHTALRRGGGGRKPTRRAAPTPQDPKGGAGATPRHPAPRRGEGDRRPTQRAAPNVKKVTTRPLR